MRIRPQLVFPRVRPPHTRTRVCYVCMYVRRMRVYVCVCVYMCVCVCVCVCVFCRFCFFFNKILCYCEKFRVCCMMCIYMHIYINICVCCVCVCVCACACTIYTGQWQISTTICAYFFRWKRGKQRREEKKREPEYYWAMIRKYVHFVSGCD